jgi:hypothetical protein
MATFDITKTNTFQEGEVGWNPDAGTLEVGRANGGSTSIGQELVFRTRNDSGSNITNGYVVYQIGFSGNKPLIDIHNGGHAPFGFATQDIDDNHNGDVTTVGYVKDVDTSAYELNAELYASTNGFAVTNRAAYPTDAFQIGRVAKVHLTDGIILAENPTCSKTWAELDVQYSRAGSGNYIVSNLTIYGTVLITNTTWNDITVSALTLSSGVAAPESRVYTNGSSTGAGIRQFNYDSGDSSFGQIQIPHSHKRNSAIYPHIHWSSIDDRSATNLTFKLDCIYGAIHGDITNTYSETITISGTNAFRHVLSSFPSFGTNILAESSIVGFEITCVNDGGADNKVFIHDIDFHFESEKLGTDLEIPNGM